MYRHSYCHRQFSFHCWVSGLIVIRSVPLYYWNMRSYFVNITCCLGLSTYQLSLYGTCCRVVNFISNSNTATLIRPPPLIKYTHGSQIKYRENTLKCKWIWRGSSSYHHFPQLDHFIAATKVPHICFTDTSNKKCLAMKWFQTLVNEHYTAWSIENIDLMKMKLILASMDGIYMKVVE